MRQICGTLNIFWRDRVINNATLETAQLLSMFTLFKQCRMRRLKHFAHVEDGCIPNDLLYSELVKGARPRGRQVKRVIRALNISIDTKEAMTANRDAWT